MTTSPPTANRPDEPGENDPQKQADEAFLASLPRDAQGRLQVEKLSGGQLTKFNVVTRRQNRRNPRTGFFSGCGNNPIFWGMITSVVWFFLLSPLITAPFGPELSPEVIDRGTATVSRCERKASTLWVMRSCQATIEWREHRPSSDLEVLSNDDLSGRTVEVLARNLVSSGRTSRVTDFGSKVRVVPATMPANTGLSVAQQFLINLGAMVVVWGGVIIWLKAGGGRNL